MGVREAIGARPQHPRISGSLKPIEDNEDPPRSSLKPIEANEDPPRPAKLTPKLPAFGQHLIKATLASISKNSLMTSTCSLSN
jgi:hypothetical protein